MPGNPAQNTYTRLAANLDATGEAIPSARLLGSDVFAVRNVMAYGAIGDDTADDTAAWQAGYDATPSRGSLFIPADKDFKITVPIVRTNAQGPIHLVCAGGKYGSSAIRQATANTIALDFQVEESTVLAEQDNACSITGLRINGPSGNTSGAGIRALAALDLDRVSVYGFYDCLELRASGAPVTGPYYSHITRSMFTSAERDGVRSVESPNHNLIFDKCRFDSCATGLNVAGALSWCEGLTVRDCAVERNSVAGIALNRVEGALIERCYFETPEDNSADLLIGSTSMCHEVTVSACRWTNHGEAVNVWHIDADLVDGLTLIGCKLPGASGTGGDIRITANTTRGLMLNTRFVTGSALVPAYNANSVVIFGAGDAGGNAVGLTIGNSHGGTLKRWGLSVDNGYSKGFNVGEPGVADGRLFVKAGGFVGMGTTDPGYNLHVQHPTQTVIAMDSVLAAGFVDLVYRKNGVEAWQVYSDNSGHLYAYSNANKVTILSGGSNVTLNP